MGDNWQVRTLRDGSINIYDGQDFIAAVGHLKGTPDVGKMKRDARLIAAAPTLVEAAMFARNRLLQDSGDQESIDQLNAALAQAKQE